MLGSLGSNACLGLTNWTILNHRITNSKHLGRDHPLIKQFRISKSHVVGNFNIGAKTDSRL